MRPNEFHTPNVDTDLMEQSLFLRFEEGTEGEPKSDLKLYMIFLNVVLFLKRQTK